MTVLPPGRRFAMHGIRKGTATELNSIDANAAQKLLGHTTAKMTSQHYLADTIVGAALSQLPQPKFIGNDLQRRLFE